jgi:thiol-disulfide isomerase/thioredoxin
MNVVDEKQLLTRLKFPAIHSILKNLPTYFAGDACQAQRLTTLSLFEELQNMLIRFSLATFASLLTCATLMAADEPKAKTDTGETPSAESSALADEVAAIEKGLADHQKKMNAAKMAKMLYGNTSAKKLLELIKENPDDPAVIDAIGLLVVNIGMPPNPSLLEKVLKSPKAGDLCLKMARPNPEAPGQELLLKQIAEKHDNADARGLATFALGYSNYISSRMNAATDEAKSKKFLGEAEKYLAKVKAEHKNIADTTFLESTVGVKTANTLSRIQNGPNLVVGKMAPEIEGVDIDGNPLKLSDSRGKVTVLIFWGSWCPPCMGLVPHEKELFARMKGKPFELVSVNCGDTKDRAQGTRKDKDMGWKCWWDGGAKDGPIQATYNVTHYPNIYVIDAKGVIRNIDIRHKQLDDAVDKLIEELNSNKVSQR